MNKRSNEQTEALNKEQQAAIAEALGPAYDPTPPENIEVKGAPNITEVAQINQQYGDPSMVQMDEGAMQMRQQAIDATRQPGINIQLEQLDTPRQKTPNELLAAVGKIYPEVAAQVALTQAFTPTEDLRTLNQKDFEYAKADGFTGSFTDFIRDTRRSTIEKGAFDIPSGFMPNPDNPDMDPAVGPLVIPISGGPQDTMTPEQAAKVQLLETALSSAEEFRKYIIKPDGEINRASIATMYTNFPFSKGREAMIYLLDSIEAKLRAESGAAVPETEVTRAGKRFKPHPFDSDVGVKIKSDLLIAFLEGAFNKSQRDGRFDTEATLDALDAEAEKRFKDSAGMAIDVSKIDGWGQLSPDEQDELYNYILNESFGGL